MGTRIKRLNGSGPCKACTLPELWTVQPLNLICDIMTDNQTSDETEGELDPITALAKEIDTLRTELSNMKDNYAKLAADNSSLLDTNRRLLGELGKITSPMEAKPPEKSASDIAYDAFKLAMGIER